MSLATDNGKHVSSMFGRPGLRIMMEEQFVVFDFLVFDFQTRWKLHWRRVP